MSKTYLLIFIRVTIFFLFFQLNLWIFNKEKVLDFFNLNFFQF